MTSSTERRSLADYEYAEKLDPDSRIHVVPVQDDREHVLSMDCACRPGSARSQRTGLCVLHFPRP